MSHDFHAGLPGYHPDQILIDLCAECEQRSSRLDHGISTLDRQRFRRACERALEWRRHGLQFPSGAEMPLIIVLAAVLTQLDAAEVAW